MKAKKHQQQKPNTAVSKKRDFHLLSLLLRSFTNTSAQYARTLYMYMFWLDGRIKDASEIATLNEVRCL